MKTALLILCLAQNTPEVEADTPGRTAKLEAGEITPFAGILLDSHEDIFRARREIRLQTKVDEYEPMVILPKAAFIGIIGGTVAVVLGIVLGSLAALHKL